MWWNVHGFRLEFSHPQPTLLYADERRAGEEGRGVHEGMANAWGIKVGAREMLPGSEELCPTVRMQGWFCGCRTNLAEARLVLRILACLAVAWHVVARDVAWL